MALDDTAYNAWPDNEKAATQDYLMALTGRTQEILAIAQACGSISSRWTEVQEGQARNVRDAVATLQAGQGVTNPSNNPGAELVLSKVTLETLASMATAIAAYNSGAHINVFTWLNGAVVTR